MTRVNLTRNRTGWWLIALLLVVVIALTYRLTRPPELVWCKSPQLGEPHLRARLLVPNDWRIDIEQTSTDSVTFVAAPEQAPAWLTWLMHTRYKPGEVSVGVEKMFLDPKDDPPGNVSQGVITHSGGRWASLYRLSYDGQYMVKVTFCCS